MIAVTGGMTMRRFHILGLAALCVGVLAFEAAARRGGAVRSGMRGAVVGGMINGDQGRSTGAKIGVVTGATRTAINREAVVRGKYQTTDEYLNAPRSDFEQTPPDVIGVTAGELKTSDGKEVVILRDGKAILAVTFPANWKQGTGERALVGVSKDGQAYALIGTLDGVPDKKNGIKKLKEGIEKHMQGVKYDDQTETKRGTLLITGTGKGKKKGVDVVFAAGVFDATKGHLGAAVFVVDAKIEDHYKETFRGICETLRRGEDFDKDGK
jgi:hypothetical protein